VGGFVTTVGRQRGSQQVEGVLLGGGRRQYGGVRVVAEADRVSSHGGHLASHRYPRRTNLRQADQARTDFPATQSGLELIMSQEDLARFSGSGSLIVAPNRRHCDRIAVVLQAADGPVLGVAIRDAERL